ncbi:MAG TPA: FtsX-like permease family protein [Chthonomonadales bacterium]|nr:FtsX-like permease family protein [Chthonomonadales bacterium]
MPITPAGQLSAWLYLRRNPGRALPVALVILVSVTLVASVVSIIRSIDLTVFTMYGYHRHLAFVSPRNALELRPEIALSVREDPLATRVFTVRPALLTVRTVFGKMPFVVLGLSPEATQVVLDRCGVSVYAGRLPADGAPEVAVSEEIARNLGLRLGSVVLRPGSEDAFAPRPMYLVGLLRGPVWIAVTSERFVRDTFILSVESLIAMAADDGAQRRLERSLSEGLSKAHARAWTFATLVRETRDALSSLYLILNVVITIVVCAIALLAGMLSSIYFRQRLPEMATLAAIGYTRGFLLRRALRETVILCVAGWAGGSALTVGLLTGLRAYVLEPRGLLLNPMDPGAFLYAAPLPLTIGAFAFWSIWAGLRRFDPVSIIERRG